MALSELDVPALMVFGEAEEVEVTNNSLTVALGTVTLTGVSNRGKTFEFSASFDDLDAGEKFEAEWDCPVRYGKLSTIRWSVTMTSSVTDINLSNDTATAKNHGT